MPDGRPQRRDPDELRARELPERGRGVPRGRRDELHGDGELPDGRGERSRSQLVEKSTQLLLQQAGIAV